MKVLYCTNENSDLQPIIESQVIPIISEFEGDIDLLTVGTSSLTKNHTVIIPSNKLKELFLIANFVNKSNYDAIHFRSYWAFIACLFMPKKSRYIWDPRGLIGEEYKMRKQGILGKVLCWLFIVIDFLLYKKCDEMVVVSNEYKKYLLGKNYVGGKKIEVIPTYSRMRVFKRAAKINYKFVYVGSMELWQKFEDIVQVFKYILNHLPESELLVITKDMKRAECVIKSKGIDPSLVKLLSCPNSDIENHISDANFAFIFRDENILNKVAAPIKISEYLNCNLYILYTGFLGDYNETLEEAGIGYDCNEVQGVIDWLRSKEDNHLNNGSDYTFAFDAVIGKYSEIWTRHDKVM